MIRETWLKIKLRFVLWQLQFSTLVRGWRQKLLNALGFGQLSGKKRIFLWILKVSYHAGRIFLVFTLPFIVLIRSAVYLHMELRLWSWLSVFGGVLMAALVIFLYLSFFYGRFTGRYGTPAVMKQRLIIALLIVAGYCFQGLLFLSESNAKEPAIRQEFRKLHPILRLSVSTIVFLDKRLLVTDGSRLPEDYKKMGLKTKKNSLHYIQSSGYAHAVDIRTLDRNFLRNFLIKLSNVRLEFCM